MTRISWLLVVLLSACVAPGGSGSSVQDVDGNRLQVRLDDNYYWPTPTQIRSSSGEMVEVEPFPLVTALVVSRVDGVPLSEADQATARAAVAAHCTAEGKGAPGSSSRFADGAWAFSPCSAAQG